MKKTATPLIRENNTPQGGNDATKTWEKVWESSSLGIDREVLGRSNSSGCKMDSRVKVPKEGMRGIIMEENSVWTSVEI